MKSLHTLIKLTKANVDEKQKALSQVQEIQDKVKSNLNEVQSNLQKETDQATKFPETALDFGAYAQAVFEKIKRMEHEIAALELIIEQKREELREAFAEQKRYEIALDMKLAEAKKQEEKREQIRNDEIAIQGFVRNNKN